MKNLFLEFATLSVCITCLFSSCLSKDDGLDTIEVSYGKVENSEISTSLNADLFNRTLDDISNLVTQTRASSFDEEKIEKALKPLTEDGEFIRKQLLDDKTLTALERENIENLSASQLAVLSLITNAYLLDIESLTRGTYATNQRLHCISEALTGGGVFVGGGVVGSIAKLGFKTALRTVCCGALGMIGGAIAAVMIINDYNTCMNG